MKKKDSKEWLNRLTTEFYDASGFLLGTNYLDLINNEKILENDLKSNYYYGFSKLMPAFFNFCIDTYLYLTNQKIKNLPYKNILYNIIHIPTFWRFRASYLIFWKGYYVSAAELLRGVIENLFTIIAVENKLIPEKDAVMYYSDMKENEKITYKEIEKRIRKRDDIIKNVLYGKDSKLSPKTKKIIEEIIIKSLHNCVHKSNNAIALYTRDWINGAPFPTIPRYHQDLSRLYLNLAFLFGWIFTRTLPLLQLEENEFSKEWKEKYQVLDELFKDIINSIPLEFARAGEEFVSLYL
jgi:hypothetical protein